LTKAQHTASVRPGHQGEFSPSLPCTDSGTLSPRHAARVCITSRAMAKGIRGACPVAAVRRGVAWVEVSGPVSRDARCQDETTLILGMEERRGRAKRGGRQQLVNINIINIIYHWPRRQASPLTAQYSIILHTYPYLLFPVARGLLHITYYIPYTRELSCTPYSVLHQSTKVQLSLLSFCSLQSPVSSLHCFPSFDAPKPLHLTSSGFGTLHLPLSDNLTIP
jgi:hypothetical protein